MGLGVGHLGAIYACMVDRESRDALEVHPPAPRVHQRLPFPPTLGLLRVLCVLIAAILAQGCILGRSLYYVEEQPSTDELKSTSSLTDSDAGDAGADHATAASVSSGQPPAPPPPPVVPEAGTIDTCNAIATPCVKGGGIEYCISYNANACSRITYKHDGKSFACSCAGTDCTAAYYGAYTSCQDAAGSCDQLATCCKTAQPNFQASCQETLKTYVGQVYGEVGCKAIVANYRQQKICP